MVDAPRLQRLGLRLAASHALTRTLLYGALVVFDPHAALGVEVTSRDREAVFRGTVEGCNEKIPKAVRQKAGAAAVLSFCSCYANEIARTVTKEQVDALATEPHPPAVSVIPRYGETMRRAWRACEKQLLTKAH